MSGETEQNISGWTVDTLAAHWKAVHEFEQRFQDERDRRYSEVGQEREKALKIKETADNNALVLAREIQTYKDEKANQLREQIGQERLLYATKEDVRTAAERLEAIITPLTGFVAAQQGERGGRISTQELFMRNIPAMLVALIMIVGAVVGVAYAIRR